MSCVSFISCYLPTWNTNSSADATELLCHSMDQNRPLFEPYPAQLSYAIFHSAPGLDFIPPSLRHAIDGSFYDRFLDIIRDIDSTLRESGIPYPTTIRTRMGHRILFYLSRGGLVEYPLDCVLHAAQEQSPLGNATFDRAMSRSDNGNDLKWVDLPHCANDLDFMLVREHLGLDITDTWGPYSSADYRNHDKELEKNKWDRHCVY